MLFLARVVTMYRFNILIVLIVLLVIVPTQAQINLDTIEHIESNGNPRAVGSSGERGLYQIMPITLKEYNNYHQRDFSAKELFDPNVNHKIAKWYIEERIPEMLKYYNKKVSTKNILWAYNAGIGRVVDGIMPETTKDYISKYFRIENSR